jgi:glycosyltransferase involved in cell wall biosynthesis
LRRAIAEVLYGIRLVAIVKRFRPDVALMSNTPTIAQFLVAKLAGDIPQVHWWQDIYSAAVRDRFSHAAGHYLANLFQSLEKAVLHRAKGVVTIAPEFAKVGVQWGIPEQKFHLIPNWAPLSERPKVVNGANWLQANGIPRAPTLLYAGTLGLKHNATLLADLAQGVTGLAQVVVLSEGPGAEMLRRAAADRALSNLFVRPFQSITELWNALDAADVLVGLLEKDAAAYSVPSKVLTYLAAGRPILLAVPRHNASAKLVIEVGAGLVVEPDDVTGFTTAARWLLGDAGQRSTMGAAGAAFARDAFDIQRIALQFERLLVAASGKKPELPGQGPTR